MLGALINRCLLMMFGYAYPAFECYKTLEKNSRSFDIEELRFWCKYWIIVAIFTVAERFGDVVIAWLPLYGEMKLAFLIYLWHPKTKGSGQVYERLMRPYLVKKEPEIERALGEVRVRAWDLGWAFWAQCSELGQSSFLKALNYAADFQPTKSSQPNSALQRDDQQTPTESPQSPANSPSSRPKSGKPPPVAGFHAGTEAEQTDGRRSTDLREPENSCNEEEQPASPYPRARLRRVKQPLP